MKRQRTKRTLLCICAMLLLGATGLLAQCGLSGTAITGNAWPFGLVGGATPFTPVTGHVVVTGTMNLAGETVFFAEDVHLIISEGAVLNAVDCSFRAVNDNETWEGIVLYPGDQLQGETQLNASRTLIHNAIRAVREGCDAFSVTLDASRTRLDTCTIENPVQTGYEVTPHAQTSTSIIFACDFHYDKPQAGLWATDVDMVKIERRCGAIIDGNTIENDQPAVKIADIQDRGDAIQLWDCTAEIKRNLIKKWSIGILIAESDGFCPDMKVTDNTIKNCRVGLKLDERNGTRIEGNAFTMNAKMDQVVKSSEPRSEMWGIWTVNEPTETIIRDNLFKHFENPNKPNQNNAKYIGINLGNTLGTQIRLNDFEFDLIDTRADFNIGIRITGTNGTTSIDCNDHDFDPGRIAGQFGWFLKGGSTLGEQGDLDNGAGNTFSPLVLCGGTLWHIARTVGAGTFRYWRDPSSTENPTCVNASVILSTALDDANCLAAKAAHAAPADPMQATLEVSPNPTYGQLTVRMAEEMTRHPVVFDARGQQLDVPQARTGAAAFVLDLSALPAGIYFVRAGAKAKRVVKR